MGKVDQQFEHLNDAQVEHYGERGSLAGTDQEQTPGKDHEDLVQKIEAHLDECPACRARVLTSARSHLALLTDAPVNTETSVNVDPSVRAAPRPDCPSEDDLRDLAAGLSPADQAGHLLQHAAQCDHCGPILRRYTEDFADDLSTEDQAVLGKLQSGSPNWQRKLANKMASAPKSSSETDPSKE